MWKLACDVIIGRRNQNNVRRLRQAGRGRRQQQKHQEGHTLQIVVPVVRRPMTVIVVPAR